MKNNHRSLSHDLRPRLHRSLRIYQADNK